MNVAVHRQQTVSGLKWKLLNQVITQATVFIVSIALMRLLGPEQFGLIGMVTVFSGFLNVFKDFGLASALIQKKEIDALDKDTVFFFSVSLGLFLAVILAVSSPLLAQFYGEPKVKQIATTLGLLFVFQALGGTHNALLRKRLLFKKLFWVGTSAVLIGGTIALIAAYKGLGVWALVLQQLLTSFITMVVLWTVSEYRPNVRFSVERFKDHLKFGLPLMGTQSFNYWSRNSDNLLIGRFLGTEALGLYSRAYSLMMLPVSRVSGVISSVMFPSLSLIQDDKERVKNIYLKISRIIAFVTFPLMGILIVVSEPFVKVVLGEQWSGMVFPLQILSIVGALQSVITLNGNIFMSQGHNKLAFKISSATSILLVTGFIIGVQYGIGEVAMIYLFISLFALIPRWYFMGRIINCKVSEILKNLAKHFFFGTSLVVILLYCKSSVLYYYSGTIQLLILSILFSIGWLVGMKIFHKQHYLEVLNIVIELIKRNKSII